MKQAIVIPEMTTVLRTTVGETPRAMKWSESQPVSTVVAATARKQSEVKLAMVRMEKWRSLTR